MAEPTARAEAILTAIKAELDRLAPNAPEYGELSVRAIIHAGRVARVEVGAVVNRNIDRGGR